MAELTQWRLKELLHYCPESGHFTWLVAPNKRVKIGDRAGRNHNKGYISICISRKHYLAHRLAYLYMTGSWPEEEIDHRDLVRNNNAWANLRASTHAQNQQNKGVFRNSKSGVKGVIYYEKRGVYKIVINKKYYGCYGDLELAELVAQEIREGLHKEFARHV